MMRSPIGFILPANAGQVRFEQQDAGDAVAHVCPKSWPVDTPYELALQEISYCEHGLGWRIRLAECSRCSLYWVTDPFCYRVSGEQEFVLSEAEYESEYLRRQLHLKSLTLSTPFAVASYVWTFLTGNW